MSWRLNLLLAGLGMAVSLLVAQFQPFPGYLDSDYYYAGGVQLAQGHGFSAPFVWNYLDDPRGLPHPTHSYWMPLASMLAAAGMWVTGTVQYSSGRLGFMLVAAAVPAVAASLALQFTHQRNLAIVTGLLAVFSIYYLPFVPVSDNYGICLVLGACFFIALGNPTRRSFFVMGSVAGLMTLARTDGMLWLIISWIAAMLSGRMSGAALKKDPASGSERGQDDSSIRSKASRIALAAAGFVVIVGPWLLRNTLVFGTPIAPGGQRLLWLTTYDETFSYPGQLLTFERWIQQGLNPILTARLAALKWNLLNAFAAQWGVFLGPFIIVGAWIKRHDLRIQMAVLAWLLILGAMTIVFPFAGSRGGFFHAGAGVQPVWWSLGPLGLETAVRAARRRGLFTPHASTVFQSALVGLAALMTAAIFYLRVVPGWGEGEDGYPAVEAVLVRAGAGPADPIMVRNPPGYYLMTGRPAIVVPYAEPDRVLNAATRFGVQYVAVEEAGAAGPIMQVYDGQAGERFEFLGEVRGTRIFRIRR